MTNFYGSHASWPRYGWWPRWIRPRSTPARHWWTGYRPGEAGKVYTAGNKVSHKGIIYQAKWWTQGNEPGKGDPWAPVT